MAAAARIETNGIPISAHDFDRFKKCEKEMRRTMIKAVDANYGVYSGTKFDAKKWASWCQGKGIGWPLLKSGQMDLNRDTFKSMAKIHPSVSEMHDLRRLLSELRNNKLALGADERSRCMLSAFGSITGRNQPSASKFIFGLSKWFRYLIKPETGKALAYIDYEQQEFAIAAALSGDQRMMAAYQSGDPYLAFAKEAKAIPSDATKDSHSKERELYKECALGVQYGMTETGLARRLKRDVSFARSLIQKHQQLYGAYWEWSDQVEDTFNLKGELSSVFGWKLHRQGNGANLRSVRNFPMQANGAEILRIACIALVEHGIKVCAPVHDAVLIEADTDQIETKVAEARELMKKASEAVLNGFKVRTDYKIVRHPDRYEDEKGKAMWDKVTQAMKEIEAEGRQPGRFSYTNPDDLRSPVPLLY